LELDSHLTMSEFLYKIIEKIFHRFFWVNLGNVLSFLNDLGQIFTKINIFIFRFIVLSGITLYELFVFLRIYLLQKVNEIVKDIFNLRLISVRCFCLFQYFINITFFIQFFILYLFWYIFNGILYHIQLFQKFQYFFKNLWNQLFKLEDLIFIIQIHEWMHKLIQHW